MKFYIKTLTPIWTGDINRECIRLRETSFIGSLRWWFELICRGLGANICDVTSSKKRDDNNEKSPSDEKICKCKYNGKAESICAACELFGTTGWARRFVPIINQNFNGVYKGKLLFNGYRKNWYYPAGLMSFESVLLNTESQADNSETDRISNSELKMNSIVPILRLYDKSNIESILKVLLVFISKWGMIGGKTAIGYGVINILNGRYPIKVSKGDIKTFFQFLDRKKNDGLNAIGAPNLSEMFFTRIRLEITDEHFPNKFFEKNINVIPDTDEDDEIPKLYQSDKKEYVKFQDVGALLNDLYKRYNFIPTSALIRKILRKEIRTKFQKSEDLRHFLLGRLGQFSAIQVSHMYRYKNQNDCCWEFRIFGWIPSRNFENSSNSEINRTQIIDFLEKTLNRKDFWNEIYVDEYINRSDRKYIVKYPEQNWNFIDFGELANNENKIRNAFEEMLNIRW